jgi:hypothetical protein
MADKPQRSTVSELNQALALFADASIGIPAALTAKHRAKQSHHPRNRQEYEQSQFPTAVLARAIYHATGCAFLILLAWAAQWEQSNWAKAETIETGMQEEVIG